MGFIFSGLFWGLVLILIGLSIIVKIVFNVDVPVFQIIIGLLLIYFGLQVLFGSSFSFTRRIERRFNRVSSRVSGTHQHHNIDNLKSGEGNDYNIIFSSGNVDLSGIEELTESVKVSVNVVFGSGVIWVNPDIPINIQSSTVFGETILPDKTVSFFGENSTVIGNGVAVLHLEINTVFGSSEVKKRIKN